MDKGSALAHRLTKPQPALPPTYDLLDERSALHKEWKAIWQATEATPGQAQPSSRDFDGVPIPVREPVSVDSIRAASRCFKSRTAAPDGWHPRSYQFLSDDALRALSSVFSVWERTGGPTGQIGQLAIKMIPKPSGGRRPIGLYHSAYRVYAKARQSEV